MKKIEVKSKKGAATVTVYLIGHDEAVQDATFSLLDKQVIEPPHGRTAAPCILRTPAHWLSRKVMRTSLKPQP